MTDISKALIAEALAIADDVETGHGGTEALYFDINGDSDNRPHKAIEIIRRLADALERATGEHKNLQETQMELPCAFHRLVVNTSITAPGTIEFRREDGRVVGAIINVKP